MEIGFFNTDDNSNPTHTGKELVVNPANQKIIENPTRKTAVEKALQFNELQAAYDAALNGDTIRLISDTTEDITLPGYLQGVTLILENCRIQGDITTPIVNGLDRGNIIGVGNASISGAVTVFGASQFNRIEGLKLEGDAFRASQFENCYFTGYGLNISTGNGTNPAFANCIFTNNNTLFRQYGFGGGSFKNCEINCQNFSTRIGGLSSVGGTFRFENTKIFCGGNGLAWRGAVNLHFINSVYSANGSDYFIYGDANGIANTYVESSKLITARTEIYSTPSNYTHINTQRNKPIGIGTEVYTNNDQERVNIEI
ncbi:hypothetical protein BKI52_33140 [marine bacterium AO1-C]|nr:hypothetical protein BKI52_33140 [marine bacterium AO1-C]